MTTLINVEGLNKSYGSKQILKDLNFSVQAGQIVGLVGPNGAGKTTCLQSLLGLTKYRGDINVLGYSPLKQRTDMLNHVAYIADVAVLPKWMKVSQLLSYVAGVHKKFDASKAEAFLAKTSISNNAKVHTLSKGMVTQLHLALILAIDTQVLILDEPTLGLDLVTRRQFYQHLLEEFYTEQKCIVITTHQIEEIEHILTDVAFIKNGEIALHDSVDALQQRFCMLAVDNDKKDQALAHTPLLTNSMMGMNNMLFDGGDKEVLSTLGKLSSATLADIFMGLMAKETAQ